MLRTLFDGGGRVLSRAHITHEFLLLSVRFQAASRADKDAEVVISKNLVGGIYRISGTQLTKKLGSSIRMELPKEEKQIDVALSGLMQKEWQLSGGLLALEHFFLKTTFDQVQGGLDPNKISGLGVDFGHLVRCLLLGNKVAARKPSLIFS